MSESGHSTAPMTPDAADELLLAAILTDEGRQNPYPAYRAIQDGLSHYDSGIGVHVMTGYDHCQAIMRNPSFGREEPDMEPPAGAIGGRARRDRSEPTNVMLLANPPDHTRLRSLVSRAFTPRRVDALRGTIERLLAPKLDELGQGGGGDLMDVLAIPFPVAVISALLGVPPDLDGTIRRHVRKSTALIDIASTEEALVEGEVARAALAEIFVDLIAEKRDAPGDDLLSGLIAVEADGDRLSQDELVANALLLYAAGFETTSNLIGNGVWMLLRHPDQLDRLRNNPNLVPSAVQEVLRFDSPVQINGRVALERAELFGTAVERGTQTLTLLGAANRDPSRYDRPDECDVARFSADTPTSRPVPPPLSYGWGIHHCLGAHLAQAEGEIVLANLLDRFATIELAADEPRYRQSFTLRGLESLELTVAA